VNPRPVFTRVYLDTSVLIGALHPGIPDSAACASFVEMLLQSRTRVYVSLATRLDFGRAVRRLATKPDKLLPDLRSTYALDHWGTNPLVRHRWLTRELKLLDTLLGQFASATEIPLTHDLWRGSLDVMGADGLDATDALHVAAARAYGIPILATCDRDFRPIADPMIHLVQDSDQSPAQN